MVIDDGAYCVSLIFTLVMIIGHRMVLTLVLITSFQKYLPRYIGEKIFVRLIR